jgi:hypothetical protein
MSALAQTLLRGLSSGAWLTSERLLGYAAILLGYELIAAAYFFALAHGLLAGLDRPVSMDFVSFYAAGDLANAGTPALAYDQAAHYAAEQRAEGPEIPYNYFYYPPIYLLLCALLAQLPYTVAYVVFEALTLLICVLIARRITNETHWSMLVPLVAFPAVFWTVGLGQNAFLTAALFGAATLLIDRRPIVAGVLFGVLAYKPHYGILVPIALAAGGHWRAFFSAGITVLALTALSVASFGWDTWAAFLAAAPGSHDVYGGGKLDTLGLATPFGATLTLGGGVTLAYAVQGLFTIGAIGWVALVWRRGLSLPVRAATLLAATPLAVPALFYYDLVLGGIAMAWLVGLAREKGFLPWEKTALAVIFLATLFTGYTNITPRVMVPPLVAAALFAVTAYRARHEMAERRHAVNVGAVVAA